VYVDGYGSASGTESAPGPGVGPGAGLPADGAAGCCATVGDESAKTAVIEAAASARAGKIIPLR
jgi:hypothetical protein